MIGPARPLRSWVVLSSARGELRWHQPVHHGASFPVNPIIVRGGIDEDDEPAGVQVAHPRHAGDRALLGVEGETRSCDMQGKLDQGLVVDLGAG
jgi:hypothetical protein